MKVRNGFVSNSSSSSYIIAFNGLDRSDLEKLFTCDKYNGNMTSVDAIGVEDVANAMKEWYGIGESDIGCGEDAEFRRSEFISFAVIASKIVKASDNGDNVAIINVSHGDEISYDNLKNNNIRIIESFC